MKKKIISMLVLISMICGIAVFFTGCADVVGTYNETNISNSYIKIIDYNNGDGTAYIHRAPMSMYTSYINVGGQLIPTIKYNYYTTPDGQAETFALDQSNGNEHTLKFIIDGKIHTANFNSDAKEITLWFGFFKK